MRARGGRPAGGKEDCRRTACDCSKRPQALMRSSPGGFPSSAAAMVFIPRSRHRRLSVCSLLLFLLPTPLAAAAILPTGGALPASWSRTSLEDAPCRLGCQPVHRAGWDPLHEARNNPRKEGGWPAGSQHVPRHGSNTERAKRRVAVDLRLDAVHWSGHEGSDPASGATCGAGAAACQPTAQAGSTPASRRARTHEQIVAKRRCPRGHVRAHR